MIQNIYRFQHSKTCIIVVLQRLNNVVIKIATNTF